MTSPDERPTLVRTLLYRTEPGQREAYEQYLRTVVDPIDAIAHQMDAFVEVFELTPHDGGEAWDVGRVFTYRDRDQLESFGARMAQAAAQFDGDDPQVTQTRKDHAATLRRRISSTVVAVAHLGVHVG